MYHPLWQPPLDVSTGGVPFTGWVYLVYPLVYPPLVYPLPRRHLGTGIPTPGRGLVSGIPTPLLEETLEQAYPPSMGKMTETSENITFSQLCWWVVITMLDFKGNCLLYAVVCCNLSFKHCCHDFGAKKCACCFPVLVLAKLLVTRTQYTLNSF